MPCFDFPKPGLHRAALFKLRLELPGFPQVGTMTQVGMTQVGMTQVGMTQVGMTQVGMTQGRCSKGLPRDDIKIARRRLATTEKVSSGTTIFL